MTTGVILALLCLAGAVAYVIGPLLRADALVPEETRSAAMDELRELHARQQMLLASLKDLEDDHATEKVGDEDYERLKARLSAQAIEVLERIDIAEREREEAAERERAASRPLQYPGKGRAGSAP